jgi:hypothetical protein
MGAVEQGLCRGGRCQKRSDGSQSISVFGAQESEVTDFQEAFGQDVLQESADEIESVERGASPLAAAALAITEGDLTVLRIFPSGYWTEQSG